MEKRFFCFFWVVDLDLLLTWRIVYEISFVHFSIQWELSYFTKLIHAYDIHINSMEVIALHHNKKKNGETTQDNNSGGQAATLAVIAGLITTLGDGLATVAAALALQEAQQNSNNGDSQQIQQMQQQIDYLTKEVKRLKRS